MLCVCLPSGSIGRVVLVVGGVGVMQVEGDRPSATKSAGQSLKLRREEAKSLRARFSTSFRVISPTSFSFLFTPSDPDFPVDVPGIELQFDIPADYPNSALPKIEVLGLGLSSREEEADLVSPQLRSKLESSIQQLLLRIRQLHPGESMIEPYLLSLLDEKLQGMLMDREFFESYMTVNAEGATQRRYMLIKRKTAAPETEPQVRPVDDSGGAGPENLAPMDGESDADAMLSIREIQQRPTSKAIDLRFVGESSIAGTTMLECDVLRITATCRRCQNQTVDVSISLKMPTYDGTCPNCNERHQILYIPEPIMTAVSSTGFSAVERSGHKIGSLVLDGCAYLDMLPSTFAALCSECGRRNVFTPLVVGRTNQRSCLKCFSKMNVSFERVEAQKAPKPSRFGSGDTDASGKSKRKVPRQELGITLGEHLPNFGCCAHYKHSHRWLRFPCCGKAFPCDLCHDENEGHPLAWATRMICGFCSLEQKCATECLGCGKELVKKGTGRIARSKIKR